MKPRQRTATLDDFSLDRLFEAAAKMDPAMFAEIMFSVAAEMAEEGVPSADIAVACGRLCARLGIDPKRNLN
ncbi:MAG: hypothetical protein U1E62_05545 [Alsobacter sp.]